MVLLAGLFFLFFFSLLGFSNPSSLLSEFFLSIILIMLYTFLFPQDLPIFYGSDAPFH